MGTEIERKFIVRSDAWRESVDHKRAMKQAYFRAHDATIRVRVIDSDAILTIKSATDGVTRGEWEYPIPHRDALELIDTFCGDRMLSKTRHYVPIDGHVFEVDEFEGELAGLIVCELELATEETPFTKPDWLGDEVSGDPRYYNEVLVKEGRPT